MSGKIDSNTIKQLWNYIKQYKLKLSFVAIFIILSAVASACSSLFLQTIIDDYISPLLLESVPNFSGLLKVIIIMGLIHIIGVLSTLFYNRFMADISQGTLKKIRDDMFSHMQKLSVKYFDTHTHGDVMSYYTNDTDTLRQAISQSLPQVFSSAISILTVFISMLYISIWLALIVVLFIIVMMFFLNKIMSKSSGYFIKQQKSLGDINGYIEEMINGQKVIKVFCHEAEAKENFDLKNNKFFDVSFSANKYANILMPSITSLGYVLYILVAVIGGSMAISGVSNIGFNGQSILTLGMIASFLQLSMNFMTPISQVSQQFNYVVTALAGAERIFSLLNEESEKDEGYITLINAENNHGKVVETTNKNGQWYWKIVNKDNSISYKKLEGNIKFENVDFGYDSKKTVLHDITLRAKPGQKIALVGGTGAGKTTITNLINRFYDISKGKITYDDIDIKDIKKVDLRKSMGIVLQDVHLFTDTILENIRYGRLNASDEECINAAKLAHANDFILMLPDGYKTVINGNGSNLSQGQRQLLSIARAAVADSPVMILDEATSSVDTNTEKIIQNGMDALMKGRTVFVIAHRLSTIKNSDSIIVLDNGQIAEVGTHEQLLLSKGKYYQLYTGKFNLA